MPKRDPYYRNTSELALLLDMSPAGVYDLTKRGIIRKEPNDLYNADMVVPMYIRHIRPLKIDGKPGGRRRNESDLDKALKLSQIEKNECATAKKRREFLEKAVPLLMEALGDSVDKFRKSIEGCDSCAEAVRILAEKLGTANIDKVLDGIEEAVEMDETAETDAEQEQPE